MAKICREKKARRSKFDLGVTFIAISVGLFGIAQNFGVLAVTNESNILKSSGDSFTSILAFVIIIMVLLFYNKTRK